MEREDARKHIIVALDVDTIAKAQTLVDKLKGKVGGFKIGFEFIYSIFATLITASAEVAHSTLDQLRELFESLDHEEFIDGKIADIPNTIKGATRAICRLQPLMFNMHAFAGPAAIEAARKTINDVFGLIGYDKAPKLLAVTLLTSLTEDDLVALGLKPKGANNYRLRLVVRYAKMAKAKGCDGVIAAATDAKAIRKACGPDFLIITPGVRLPGANTHDQKNVTTPGQSIASGADGLVVGRDITGAEDPAVAAELVIDNIILHVNADVTTQTM